MDGKKCIDADALELAYRRMEDADLSENVE